MRVRVVMRNVPEWAAGRPEAAPRQIVKCGCECLQAGRRAPARHALGGRSRGAGFLVGAGRSLVRNVKDAGTALGRTECISGMACAAHPATQQSGGMAESSPPGPMGEWSCAPWCIGQSAASVSWSIGTEWPSWTAWIAAPASAFAWPGIAARTGMAVRTASAMITVMMRCQLMENVSGTVPNLTRTHNISSSYSLTSQVRPQPLAQAATTSLRLNAPARFSRTR